MNEIRIRPKGDGEFGIETSGCSSKDLLYAAVCILKTYSIVEKQELERSWYEMTKLLFGSKIYVGESEEQPKVIEKIMEKFDGQK